ncbi:dimethyladenosine transferase [Catonella morbi ATCC 51271]|uniref:Ribosomal RNA small subunit methyltransferase A n=1 Tax=Catonella morbi ATCC 51271 TaxID=592026 RepID=V2Y4N6_9FIRM|nr:16S rRNA (adenine(1518)-N(6)/adenine(1519)-N(6))-dimethyltransferase RsmA [Catonella morbi]ESL03918.1 dimethyladenosine transferase [Catonella morbi ATCC 51271]
MADLGQPQNTIAILKKYDFTFQKKFGQNFLIDTHVLEKIVDAADIGKDDLVLEIGPGIGTVTQYLCEAARQVIAVEIDRKLIKILKDTLSAYDNVEVINEDILKVDIAALVEEKNEGKPIKVVSNLPYYITTPIIMTLLEKRVPVTDMTLMMQEEVARRMQAAPGNKDYGALSLAVQYYSVPYIAAFVPQNCFMPRPNVGSAVVNLKCHEKPPVEVMDEELMFKLIKASFAQRRKTLQNGLTNSAELDFTKEEITEAILKMQELLGMKQNPLIRGETLTLKEFACLSDIFSNNKRNKGSV